MSRVIAIRQGQPRAVIMAGLRGAPGTGGVSSFNGRTGVVSLTGSDVTTALAYTPADAASLATVATSGAYGDLSGKPFIPALPGDIGAATAVQGALADSAVQPADIADVVRDGDSRLSDSRTPTGGAGGVLSGSYP
ncbi:hypothetical protein ACNFCJ_14460, partial [Pseudomonas sp. NY15364]|uniref:hypothetical protein n=1 Tax=Pseudomonas sp. NY15364 TaxID=3400353 RepID=UPI003A89CCD7